MAQALPLPRLLAPVRSSGVRDRCSSEPEQREDASPLPVASTPVSSSAIGSGCRVRKPPQLRLAPTVAWSGALVSVAVERGDRTGMGFVYKAVCANDTDAPVRGACCSAEPNFAQSAVALRRRVVRCAHQAGPAEHELPRDNGLKKALSKDADLEAECQGSLSDACSVRLADETLDLQACGSGALQSHLKEDGSAVETTPLPETIKNVCGRNNHSSSSNDDWTGEDSPQLSPISEHRWTRMQQGRARMQQAMQRKRRCSQGSKPCNKDAPELPRICLRAQRFELRCVERRRTTKKIEQHQRQFEQLEDRQLQVIDRAFELTDNGEGSLVVDGLWQFLYEIGVLTTSLMDAKAVEMVFAEAKSSIPMCAAYSKRDAALKILPRFRQLARNALSRELERLAHDEVHCASQSSLAIGFLPAMRHAWLLGVDPLSFQAIAAELVQTPESSHCAHSLSISVTMATKIMFTCAERASLRCREREQELRAEGAIRASVFGRMRHTLLRLSHSFEQRTTESAEVTREHAFEILRDVGLLASAFATHAEDAEDDNSSHRVGARHSCQAPAALPDVTRSLFSARSSLDVLNRVCLDMFSQMQRVQEYVSFPDLVELASEDRDKRAVELQRQIDRLHGAKAMPSPSEIWKLLQRLNLVPQTSAERVLVQDLIRSSGAKGFQAKEELVELCLRIQEELEAERQSAWLEAALVAGFNVEQWRDLRRMFQNLAAASGLPEAEAPRALGLLWRAWQWEQPGQQIFQKAVSAEAKGSPKRLDIGGLLRAAVSSRCHAVLQNVSDVMPVPDWLEPFSLRRWLAHMRVSSLLLLGLRDHDVEDLFARYLGVDAQALRESLSQRSIRSAAELQAAVIEIGSRMDLEALPGFTGPHTSRSVM